MKKKTWFACIACGLLLMGIFTGCQPDTSPVSTPSMQDANIIERAVQKSERDEADLRKDVAIQLESTGYQLGIDTIPFALQWTGREKSTRTRDFCLEVKKEDGWYLVSSEDYAITEGKTAVEKQLELPHLPAAIGLLEPGQYRLVFSPASVKQWAAAEFSLDLPGINVFPLEDDHTYRFDYRKAKQNKDVVIHLQKKCYPLDTESIPYVIENKGDTDVRYQEGDMDLEIKKEDGWYQFLIGKSLEERIDPLEAKTSEEGNFSLLPFHGRTANRLEDICYSLQPGHYRLIFYNGAEWSATEFDLVAWNTSPFENGITENRSFL